MRRQNTAVQYAQAYRLQDHGFGTPCWIFAGLIDRSTGYGHVYLDGRRMGAHRWFYERHVRPLLPKEQVHHRCKMEACVNPDHLEALRHRDHSQSLEDKRSILTVDQVREIKAIALDPNRPTHKEIGLMHGVSKECISGILSGRRWTNVVASLPRGG